MNYHGFQGFDISTWQDSPLIAGHVDFKRMRDWGADFVIIRAGQGNWYDLDFPTSWANAKGILPRASYWYYDNRFPPKDQARKYFETIQRDLEGMCWLDLEDRQSGIYAGWRNWYDFCEELKAVYPGVRLGIYTGFYYWYDYITFAAPAQRDYFGQYPLWLAWYSIDPMRPDYSNVLTPLPWLEYDILQTGTPGIGEDVGVESKDIDYNHFNGDEVKFRKFFKMIDGPTTPPETGDPTMTQWYQVSATTLNIRTSPAVTASNDIGDLLKGDKIETTGAPVNGGWVKIVTIYRGATRLPLPASESWCQSSYCVPTTPPTEPRPVAFPPEVQLIIDGVTKTYTLKA